MSYRSTQLARVIGVLLADKRTSTLSAHRHRHEAVRRLERLYVGNVYTSDAPIREGGLRMKRGKFCLARLRDYYA